MNILKRLTRWLFIIKIIDYFVNEELSKHYRGYFKRINPGVYRWIFDRGGMQVSFDVAIPNTKHNILNRHMIVMHGDQIINDIIDTVMADREFNKSYNAIIKSFEYEIKYPRFFSIDNDGTIRQNIEGVVYVVDEEGEIIEEQKIDLEDLE